MTALPNIPERDLRGVNCCLCGEWELQELTHQNRSLAEPPPVCSPCRAERTQAIHLRLPKASAPGDIAQRLDPLQGGTTPEYLSGAIQTALSVWARALYDSADSVMAAFHLLRGRPDEERVAATLMGDALVTGLEFLPDPEMAGIKLTGLAPELARRIATEVPLAEGPALSHAHLAEIRLLLTERLTEKKALRAARRKAQPTAPLPADGSDGDAP